MRDRIIKWVVAGAALLGSALAHAHGGVSIEFDKCVVQLGKYTMHFTAYQQATGGKENCWDLPGPGRTILVFDLVEPEMRNKPVELRVVELPESGELSGGAPLRTLGSLPVKVYPQGTLNLESDFELGKRYMAVLTMSDARPLVLKAPIQVVPNSGTSPYLIGLGVVVLGVGAFLFMRLRQSRTQAV
jgi:hypothetical protein